MKNDNDAADFATILGAAVHDMKNSLWLLLENINQVADELQSTPAGKSLAAIQYEAQRLNTGLMQLLSLYKNEYQALPVNMEAQFIDELWEELAADNALYAQKQQLTLNFQPLDDLTWFMDKHLIRVLLQDVIINSLRYAEREVNVAAAVTEEQRLHIRITDDGQGYPDDVLTKQQGGHMDVHAGRTGLGLYFASRIANAHQRRGQCGAIKISNQVHGGGVFELWLP